MTDARSSTGHGDWMQPDVERLLDQFDLAWQGLEIPRLTDFVPPASSEAESATRLPVLQELIKIDLEYRWRGSSAAAPHASSGREAGRSAAALPPQPRVEDYLLTFPELEQSADLPLLVAEEYRVRRRFGDHPDHGEYHRRFANLSGDLAHLLAEVDKELLNLSLSDSGPASLAGSQPASLLAMADQPAPSRQRDNEGLPADSDAKGQRHDSTVRECAEAPTAFGRYQVQSLLGEGAFGAVYLAVDPRLERRVAIKVLHERRLKKPLERQQFQREAQRVATLRHPHLVHVYDVNCEGENCYMVMEYIQGQTLSTLLASSRLNPAAAAALVAQIAEAVHEAHKVGLVHCDLKPGNVLIDDAGLPHVTDFGLAVREEEQRSQAGARLGTPAYMAPEQVRGEAHRLDGRTDLWCLGVMFYEMLCGRRPFHGGSVDELFDEINYREPKPPRQIDDTIPPDLERICLRCLSKEISNRYTTGKDLAEDLYRFLREHPEPPLQSGMSVAQSAQQASRRALTQQPASQPAGAPISSSGSTGRKTNLPETSNQFIGRRREVAELIKRFTERDAKLVTVTGPGGVGKTRLSLEVAGQLVDYFEGGCWFVDLTTATTAEGVAGAVLFALGVPLQDDVAPVQFAADVLGYRKPLLLLLDNFEQTVEHAAGTVGVWLKAVPHLRMLVTSRTPLVLAGEQQSELTPLSTPAADGAEGIPPGQFESVLLFQQRVDELSPGFALSEGDLSIVGEICRRLDGLPLAVELAAARAKILKPAQILGKLDRKFQLLKSTRRDLSPRQQTLQGAIDWSYDLLDEPERHAFMQLSVLPGGFFLDAAEAILDLDAFPPAPLGMDVVQSLREKCLLRAVDTPVELRFSMYQSIREYGEQKRRETFTPQSESALRLRMADYLVEYAQRCNARLHAAGGLEALERIALEKENLLSAIDWSLENQQHDLAARGVLAIGETLSVRGPAAERLPRIEQALAGASECYQVRLLVALSEASRTAGDARRAVETAAQAVTLAQQQADQRDQALALWQLGETQRFQGDTAAANASLQHAEKMARAQGDDLGVVRALVSRGFLIWQSGQVDEASQCYGEAAVLARRLGDEASLAQIMRRQGHVFAQRGEYEQAMLSFDEAEEIARRRGDRRNLHRLISSRATVYSEQGKYDAALQCYRRAESIARALGESRGIAVNQANRGLALADLGQYEEALRCFASAEQINREIENQAGVAVNIGNRGQVQAAQGDYEAALASLCEAEQLHRSLGNRMQIAVNCGDRGDVLRHLGRLPEACAALRETTDILQSLGAGNSAEYFLYQTLLAATEAALGESRQALEHAQAARDLASELELTEEHPRLRIRRAVMELRGLPGEAE